MRPLPNPPVHGATLVVVLVLLAVMLMGALAAARITEVGTLASGNSARRDAALQASDIGVNEAYQAVKALASVDSSVGTWYFATLQATGADGLPAVSFDAAPQRSSGAYTVAYIVERLCNGPLPVTEPLRQCLVKQVDLPGSAGGGEVIEPPMAPQFRITVRVTGPKNTRVWVQSLVTKGQA